MVATNTAMGTARAKIQARFKKMYSIKSENSNPLPKNLSILLNKKFASSTNNKTNNAMIKGGKCSFKIYLLINFMFGIYRKENV